MAVVEQTVDIIGDDALCDVILSKSVPEGYPVDLYDESATFLRDYALMYMDGLQSVRFTNVKEVGTSALHTCSSLMSIDMEKCTRIGNYAFQNCKELVNVNMPALESASPNAFSMPYNNEEDNLKTINLPSLRSVPDTFFGYRRTLENVIVPKAYALVSNAFCGCSGIHKLDFPSVTVVRSTPFRGCTHLEVINFGKVVSDMSDTAFKELPEGCVINMVQAEGEVSGAPWGGTGVIINYEVPYCGDVPMPT